MTDPETPEIELEGVADAFIWFADELVDAGVDPLELISAVQFLYCRLLSVLPQDPRYDVLTAQYTLMAHMEKCAVCRGEDDAPPPTHAAPQSIN